MSGKSSKYRGARFNVASQSMSDRTHYSLGHCWLSSCAHQVRLLVVSLMGGTQSMATDHYSPGHCWLSSYAHQVRLLVVFLMGGTQSMATDHRFGLRSAGRFISVLSTTKSVSSCRRCCAIFPQTAAAAIVGAAAVFVFR